ncbi:MAG TPA: hypothetical protein VLF41_00095 [Candidatus Nanoarchaeia archaeon]|nr:hypothetical protein [Candidatus Nanoarchaeia archaeon]
MNNDLTPKQQTSEALRQAETILIATAQHPSIDQATAVLAAGLILRKLGKKVTLLISDQLPPSMNFLATNEIDKSLTGLRDFILKVDLSKSEVDKIKYTVEGGKLNVHVTPFKGGFAPSDVTFAYGGFHYDVAMVLGVPARSRLDRVFEQNSGLFNEVPILNIDFHRSNENYGAVNLIEPTAASLAEILVALSESLETGMIDAQIATIMLTGIISSTDRFTASHTTAKALTVAAQLMAAGADQQKVVKNLYQQNQNRDQNRSRQDNKPKQEQSSQSQQQPPRSAHPNQPQPGQVVQPQPAQPAPEPVIVSEVELPQPAVQPIEPTPPAGPEAYGFGFAEQAPTNGNFDQVAETFNGYDPSPSFLSDNSQQPLQ